MCDITNKKTNRRIGYKVLVYRDGKYYSTFTGQEIKVGKVSMPPTYVKRISSYWNSRVDDHPLCACVFYNAKFKGKTSAFINKQHGERFYLHLSYATLFTEGEIVLVKITFINNVFVGEYQGKSIIASDMIKSIKQIKVK